MFALFVDDSFKDFWMNVPGDVFIEGTLMSLRVDGNKADLMWYGDLQELPKYFDFGSGKELNIKVRHVTIVEEPSLDAEGKEILDEQGNPVLTSREVESFSVSHIMIPEVYYLKGRMVKLC